MVISLLFGYVRVVVEIRFSWFAVCCSVVDMDCLEYIM